MKSQSNRLAVTGTIIEPLPYFAASATLSPGFVMGYGDFTFDSLLAEFGLAIAQTPLFAPPPRVDPPPWLLDTLQKGRSIAFYSEKSRSEFIVAPVLLTC
jgi:hypothetical protein